MGFLGWLVVGLVAGWLTGKIMGGPGKGVLMDIIIGIAGAFVGGLLMRVVGFSPEGGYIYTILVATLGAILLTWIVRRVSTRTA